jgi:hypothetical protein
MTTATSLLGFAHIMQELTRSLPVLQHAALEHAAQVVEKEAKRVIGTYDYGWTPLAEATKADRVEKGFSPDDPGLRTGQMRESIEHVSSSHEATIGSNDDKLVWFELGTKTQPPRSVLAGALQHKAHEVVEIIGHGVAGKLATGDVNMGYGAPAYPSEGNIRLCGAAGTSDFAALPPASGRSGNFNP